MAFVNKMDILGADFFNTVDEIGTKLGKNAVVVELPIGKEDHFDGVVDLFEMKAYIYNDKEGMDISVVDIPDDMKEEAEMYHGELVEKICDLDDDLMEKYLEGNEPSIDELKKALRKGTVANEAVPVLCGSAHQNKGIQKLLDAVLDFMPAPTDVPDIDGTDMEGNEITRKSSDDEPFSALAFKIMTDPFIQDVLHLSVFILEHLRQVLMSLTL